MWVGILARVGKRTHLALGKGREQIIVHEIIEQISEKYAVVIFRYL